ncbi:hypothetical protein GCM10008986_24750 [Salinibacillus aidingensis]|uniref:Uncharacterized protein n=1 Tax=Salinibacillus aidingensis TaxID=237684 RepID=A0ABN1BFM5_9BACI
MSRKAVLKVSFNEDQQAESYHFIKRLIEKMLLDQLDLDPKTKGLLLMESRDIIEKE